MKRESLIDETDKLLFDILETQRAILDELKALNVQKVELPSEDKTGVKKLSNTKKMYPCKHCGGEHEKSIQIVNCGKKKNKKG